MAVKSGLNKQQKHLAVLIDADNASAAIVEGLFEEIAKYGVASVKRIYGDWTGPQLSSWKKVLLEHSIQQLAYTTGKNEKVIETISGEDGWAAFVALGVTLRKLKPDFDALLYGYAKLSDLIKARNGQFELQQQGVTATGGRVLAVRNRKNGGLTPTPT